jgi:hypothetical protein
MVIGVLIPSPGLKVPDHACVVCCLVQTQVEARIRMVEASSSQFANTQMVVEVMKRTMDGWVDIDAVSN